MISKNDYDLRKENTFAVSARAKRFVEANTPNELKDALAEIPKYDKYFILGGGSNVLFVGDYDGLVIRPNVRGMRIASSEDGEIVLQVGAGENWHEFVLISLQNKYYGFENLAMIPGSVGASPVQNIGAYGVEQKDFFVSLTAVDVESGETREFSREDCDFGYRDSIFKRPENRYVITGVRYKLSRTPVMNASYGAIAAELKKFSFIEPDTRYIFDTVCRLRKSKLPDPEELPNAGSFFKNPEIGEYKLKEILRKDSDIPNFVVSPGKFKIPAARLIENCGLKGLREGDVGVYDKHALIIVNYGSASGADILKFSEKIRSAVRDQYGVELEREVRLVQ